MVLSEQAKAIGQLAQQLRRGTPIEPTEKTVLLLEEVEVKLKGIQEFLDEMYEQSTGKKVSGN